MITLIYFIGCFLALLKVLFVNEMLNEKWHKRDSLTILLSWVSIISLIKDAIDQIKEDRNNKKQ